MPLTAGPEPSPGPDTQEALYTYLLGESVDKQPSKSSAKTEIEKQP